MIYANMYKGNRTTLFKSESIWIRVKMFLKENKCTNYTLIQEEKIPHSK